MKHKIDKLWKHPAIDAQRAASILSILQEYDGCFGPQKSPPLVLLGGILPFLPSDLADACDARHLATFLGVLIMVVPVQTSHVSARRSLSAFFVSQFSLA